MSDLSLVFLMLLFCTLFIGGIVGAGVIAQRNGPTARFARRHVREIWLVLGAFWALAATFHFIHPSPQLGQVQAWTSVAVSVCMLILGLVHRRSNRSDSGESPSHPAA